jgi:hypothetical protein
MAGVSLQLIYLTMRRRDFSPVRGGTIVPLPNQVDMAGVSLQLIYLAMRRRGFSPVRGGTIVPPPNFVHPVTKQAINP